MLNVRRLGPSVRKNFRRAADRKELPDFDACPGRATGGFDFDLPPL
jgi:hypothetical protein